MVSKERRVCGLRAEEQHCRHDPIGVAVFGAHGESVSNGSQCHPLVSNQPRGYQVHLYTEVRALKKVQECEVQLRKIMISTSKILAKTFSTILYIYIYRY